MANLFTNTDPTGTLPKAFTSSVGFAANARTEGFVGNLSLSARLFVSFGTNHGSGVGSVAVEPSKGLDFSDSPVRLAGAVYVTGSTDGQTFTFQEVADTQSVATVS